MMWGKGGEIRLWFVCFLCKTLPKRLKFNEIGIYIFKVKKKRTRTRSEICSKLTNKTPKRDLFCRSGVFIVGFEIILFYSRTLTFKKIFAKLKFSSAFFGKIPSFVCLVFKIENK